MVWLHHRGVQVVAVLVLLLGFHLCLTFSSEPFFNNDETRHTLTGVFFRDAYADAPAFLADPKAYAVRYYCQYPGLGVVVWPPLFYIVEGAAMTLFGPHFAVGRWCIAAFAAWGLVSVYRLTLLNAPHAIAVVVMLLTALTPLVFVYSERVMLEIPTFAFAFAGLLHFEKYLRHRGSCCAILACVFAACAALTRFDGIFVGLYFVLRLLTTGHWGLLLKRPVLLGMFLALMLTVPYYAFTAVVYRQGLSGGTIPDQVALPWFERWSYYFSTLPDQASWHLSVAALCGLMLALWQRRGVSIPLTLMLAVYLFFSLMHELEWRHAVYWLPGLAMLCGRGIEVIREQRSRRIATVLALSLVACSVWTCYWQAFRYVFGYEVAAKWVHQHRQTDRPVLMDGELTTSFVYHMLKHDDARQVWVLRGDKLLYSMFSSPDTQYKQHAETEAQALMLIERADPEFLVIEDPPADFHRIEGSELLRRTLRNNPAVFECVQIVPIITNYDKFTDPGTQLVIFRKRHRNPDAAATVEIEVFGLGQTLGVPRK